MAKQLLISFDNMDTAVAGNYAIWNKPYRKKNVWSDFYMESKKTQQFLLEYNDGYEG